VLEHAEIGLAAEARRLAADERLERVADRVVVGDRRLVPLVAHHEVVQARACGRLRDEHAAARAGPGGEHAAHLEQADRLVDRRQSDAETRPQLLLGAEPLARAQLAARDLLLELAGDRLAERDAGCRQEGVARRLGHPLASVREKGRSWGERTTLARAASSATPTANIGTPRLVEHVVVVGREDNDASGLGE
jgi:hypothetical protein